MEWILHFSEHPKDDGIRPVGWLLSCSDEYKEAMIEAIEKFFEPDDTEGTRCLSAKQIEAG